MQKNINLKKLTIGLKDDAHRLGAYIIPLFVVAADEQAHRRLWYGIKGKAPPSCASSEGGGSGGMLCRQ